MRFLVDECAPTYITALLRERGHDVLDPREAHLRGASDEALLAIAAKEGRIIVTRDLDFSMLVRQEMQPAGAVLLRYPNTLGPLTVTRLFEAFVEEGGLERALGKIAILTPGRARFRRMRLR